MYQRLISVLCMLTLLFHGSFSRVWANASEPTSTTALTSSQEFFTGYFTENKGQWDESIRFVSRNAQQLIAITLDGIWTFHPKEATPSLSITSVPSFDLPDLPEAVPMNAEFTAFPATESLKLYPEGLLPQVHHYFIGNDASRWATHCRNYAMIRIHDHKEDTDLLLSFQDHELILSPHTTSSYILGHARELSDTGINMGYLTLDSRDHPMIAGFTTSTNFMQDEIPDDQDEWMADVMSFVLKLDPVTQEPEFVTFIGGSGANMLLGFNLNSKGQILLSGITDSDDFPIQDPLEDMGSIENKMIFMAGFVVMLSPDGAELTHSSYFFGPQAMMTAIMSQNLDHQDHWFFYSFLFGTEGFEHDHALVEESDDEMVRMLGNYLIQIDTETFTITKRILLSYGMTLVLSMDASPDGHLFMAGMSMDMSGLMSVARFANDGLESISNYSVVLDPEKKTIVAHLDFASETLNVVTFAKWSDDNTLHGIVNELTMDEEEMTLQLNTHLFSYHLQDQKLDIFSVASEEDYLFGNIYINPEGQLCLLGSVARPNCDHPLPFIEGCDLEEEEYRQAFLLIVDPDTREILYATTFGGPAVNSSTFMAFAQDGSVFILGQSQEMMTVHLDPTEAIFGFSDIKLFLITLLPGIDDQHPPQITLDHEALSYTNKSEVTVSGSIIDQESSVKLAKINQLELVLDEEGRFSHTLTLEEGSNLFLIQAWDSYNNKAEQRFELVYDPHAPMIDMGKIAAFNLGIQKNPSYTFKVTSSLSPVKRVTVTVNDSVQYENPDSGAEVSCMAPLTIQKGENKIRFTAWNMAGNQAEKEFIYWLGVSRVIHIKIGSNQAQVSIDGNTEEVTLDAPPIIVSSRSFLPLRFLATSLGAEVTWQASDQSILLEFQGMRLTLWIGLNYAIMVEQKDGQVISKTMELDAPPLIHNNRTMVPVRFIAEVFGSEVAYEAATQSISVRLITLE